MGLGAGVGVGDEFAEKGPQYSGLIGPLMILKRAGLLCDLWRKEQVH